MAALKPLAAGLALLVVPLAAAAAGKAGADTARDLRAADGARHSARAHPPPGALLRADPLAHWRTEIARASARFAVPATWVERVIRAESGGRTMIGGQPIRSSAGAMGLMQLMPATWAAMRAAHGLGNDPHDPADNIFAGTAYLRALYDRFGYPGLFAAYNAGPGRYVEHLRSGRALPRETRAYLAAVADIVPETLETAESSPHPPSPESLFIALRAGDRSGGEASPRIGNDGPYSSKADPLFAVHAQR